ncbi:MAG: hypothetical protein ABIZ05_18435 [Pseudonocardiaceae bacterium]
MSVALSFSEIVGQHAELLPARTVMSMFSAGSGSGCGCTAAAPAAAAPTGTAAGTSAPGVTGGAGGPAMGTASFYDNWFYTEGDTTINVIGGAGGAGGAVSGAAPAAGTAG